MSRSLARASLAAALLALLAADARPADKPTKVEIGKRGKAATAFVEVPGHGTGTAFCVHPSGLFVTNEHVVRGAEDAEIVLVLNPALPAQQTLKAKVARVDKGFDLALLRVESTKDLPSLPLGSVDDVAELSDVVAVGFPLGRALAPDRKEYPAVSVNAGSVTALRHKGGELQHIQVDVSLTFGNSGGPVLDENGKVIGVVVSGIALGKGINQAIPVTRLARFLKAPDIRFTPPALTPDALGKPVEFRAAAVAVMPGAPEPTLRLVLRAGDGAAREFPMVKRAGGGWAVSAVPGGAAPADRVEVTAKFAAGTMTGLADDAVVKVGGKPVRLGTLRRIETGPKARAVLADGKTAVAGEVTGLGTVEVALGGQTVKLDLAKATEITVQPAAGATTVTATVVATAEGKEVARVEVAIPVRDPGRTATADPSSVAITPTALDGDKVVKRLPDAWADVVAGGGGRYLVFHLAKLRKLAVFDISEARVVRYIPLAEDNIAFAAGLDSVVVGLRGAGKLQRWGLTTGELERTAPPPFKEEIGTVLMGHGSNGPVVVNGYFIDPATLRPLPVYDEKGKDQPLGGGVRIPSADGTVYGAWNTRYSPGTATTFVVEGGVVKRYDEGTLGHVVPGPDGREAFTAKGVVTRSLGRPDVADVSFGYCLPAVRGSYFLSLTPAAGGKGGGVTVYLRGLKDVIAKPAIDHGLSFDGWDRDPVGPWRRVYFVPDAKVIAILPAGNDQVVLHRFDADAALEKSGLDYLLVTSRPPREAKPGATLTYPVVVKSKAGGAVVKLDLGPPGMAVSAAGVLTWAVPADAAPGEREVILSVRDKAGQEVFHTFTVAVAGK